MVKISKLTELKQTGCFIEILLRFIIRNHIPSLMSWDRDKQSEPTLSYVHVRSAAEPG